MQAIRAAAPEVVLIVGGPEVSYEYDAQAICQLADYVITHFVDVGFDGVFDELGV
jgi:hypothetical protein